MNAEHAEPAGHGASMEQAQQLVQALRSPQAYGHETGDIELIETHSAWVLLTGRFGYKIKKPLNFGFLDYSTLEKRRFNCEEEVRLNRRFAPQIYLDVVAVTGTLDEPRMQGDAPVLEYAVRMRQFPANGLLSELARDGRLDGALVEQMIDQVAEFHQTTGRAAPDAPFGAPEQIHHWVVENFDHIRPAIDAQDELRQLDRLRAWVETQSQQLDTLFRDRKREGFVRECHGDLHLRNMTLIDGKVTLFDCIEFNPQLRWIDVISEVAFLMMDLEERGYPHLANQFLNGYLQRTGDYGGLRLLRYYLVYRALVRAKVSMLRRRQESSGSPEYRKADADYRQYLHLAEGYAAPATPALLLMHGLSGSGKSTVARALCEALGMMQIRSDVERKRLSGMGLLDKSGSSTGGGIYTAQHTAQTYARLRALAEEVMAAGYVAIVDATFLQKTWRDSFRRLAGECGVPFLILHCQAADAELERRIPAREAGGGEVSEADLGVLAAQRNSLDPLAGDELAGTVRIDTENSDYRTKLLDTLRRRLARSR
jgi:uncharacterized protein